ncbi:hypothetical protein BD809_10533 [Aquimarina intermedia]|uniref:UbiA prenyltransferase family protein n=2 Tax=Aquimarina intermedia TaxID=350814 RepID=A0A5S5C4V7_9FLAO|nr:hypothetical protein BD809_10533 [Aquimarina intermedia]
MKQFQIFFKFYINSSIHVAIAICSLVILTQFKFGLQFRSELLIFMFSGSIVGYNIVKYTSVSNLYHRRLTKSMKAIQWFTVLSALFFLGSILYFEIGTLLYMIPVVILTALYALPIFPRGKSLRNVARIKIYIIGLVWAIATVVVPSAVAEADFTLALWVETLQRFLFIVVVMLPFEIRDLQYDDTSLQTIPQLIGITNTKIFGSALMIIFLLLTLLKSQIELHEIYSTLLITILILLFLWNAKKRQSEYYCSFWVESVPLFWLVIYIALL